MFGTGLPFCSSVGNQYDAVSFLSSHELAPVVLSDSGVENAVGCVLPMNVCRCDAPGIPGNTSGSSGACRVTLQLACISWYCANGTGVVEASASPPLADRSTGSAAPVTTIAASTASSKGRRPTDLPVIAVLPARSPNLRTLATLRHPPVGPKTQNSP